MSEFKFACPVCGQHITCDSGSSGTPMDCPTCFRKLVVPQATSNAPGSLVLTAALFQSRPATSLSSQTDVIARRLSAAKRVRAIALAVIVLAALVMAAVLVLHLSHNQNTPPALTDTGGSRLTESSDGPTPTATNWTLNLARAKIPDEPASGRVDGRGFELERATIQLGRLDLRQGPNWPPNVGVSVHLYAQRTEDLAGRTVTIEATRTNAPRVILRWKNKQGEPVTEDYHHGYALRVEFGAVSGNRLPGKIYLATPDDPKSYVAGTFNADIRKPPPKP
jgi:hypothetical protein